MKLSPLWKIPNITGWLIMVIFNLEILIYHKGVVISEGIFNLVPASKQWNQITNTQFLVFTLYFKKGPVIWFGVFENKTKLKHLLRLPQLWHSVPFQKELSKCDTLYLTLTCQTVFGRQLANKLNNKNIYL